MAIIKVVKLLGYFTILDQVCLLLKFGMLETISIAIAILLCTPINRFYNTFVFMLLTWISLPPFCSLKDVLLAFHDDYYKVPHLVSQSFESFFLQMCGLGVV